MRPELPLLLAGVFVVADVKGDCVGNQQAMVKCLTPLGPNFAQHGGVHKLFEDLTTTRKLCREGKIQDAMTCLQGNYEECAVKSRDTHQIDLDILLDVGKWRNGMQTLCNNIDYFELNEQCTQKMSVESSDCIQSRIVQIERVISNKHTSRAQLLEKSCRLAYDILDCMKSPLKTGCPRPYSRLVDEILLNFIPPYCSTNDDDGDEDDNEDDPFYEEEEEDDIDVRDETSENANTENNFNDKAAEQDYNRYKTPIPVGKAREPSPEGRTYRTEVTVRRPGMGAESRYSLVQGQVGGTATATSLKKHTIFIAVLLSFLYRSL